MFVDKVVPCRMRPFDGGKKIGRCFVDSILKIVKYATHVKISVLPVIAGTIRGFIDIQEVI
jgi:hypothetical protein